MAENIKTLPRARSAALPRPGRLSLGRTLALSLPFAWISIFNAVLDNGLPVILTDPVADGGLALNDTLKGVVMALDNILGLFLLPLFGWLSDRSRSKWGKRTPLALAGGVLAALLWGGTGAALGMHANGRSAQWLFLLLLTGALAAVAFSRPASLAILPDFTPLPHRRTANAVTQIVSIVCTVVGILLISVFAPLGYDRLFFATAALMLLLVLLFLLTVKERRWSPAGPAEDGDGQAAVEGDAKKKRSRVLLLVSLFFFYVSYNGLVSSLSVYAKDVLGLDKSQFILPQALTLAAAMAFAVPAALLAKRFRRKNLLLLGVGIMIAAFTLAGFQPALNPVMFLCFFFTGGGFAVALVNLYPYLLELSDAKKVGSATGIFNTVMTFAMVVTPIASGWLSDHTPWGRRVLFPYCIAALALSFLFLLLISERKKAAV
ncbi:MAG: MFS transporter [Oscillospiraceae bacterium]|jgi:MFS family permease|nr:MFS transporter [Oscillospiraceae bacterium]